MRYKIIDTQDPSSDKLLSEAEALDIFKNIHQKGYADGWFDSLEDDDKRDEQWEKTKNYLLYLKKE